MEFIDTILSNLLIFQIVTSCIKVTVGAGLCFGALKWRRGLLTTTAISWGFFLGLLIMMMLNESFDSAGSIFIVCACVILLPILTYTIPGVNRFMLGFIVGNKLAFMVTTELAKERIIDIQNAIIIPLAIGTIVGVVLMAWTKVRVSAFVIGCAFLGSCEMASTISEWINRIFFSVTGDVGYLFDPIDLLFSLFKIELTDIYTFISLVVLMILGIRTQIKSLQAQGIPLSTPVIGFEIPAEDE